MTDDNAGARAYCPHDITLGTCIKCYEKLRLERDEAVALKDKAAEIAIAIGFEHNRMVKERDELLAKVGQYASVLNGAGLERDELRAEFKSISKLNDEIRADWNDCMNNVREQERERSRKLREALEMYAMTSETFPEYGEVARDALATNGPLATEIEESNRALRLLEAEREKSGNLRHHLAGLIEMVKVEHGLECGVDYEINDTSAIGDAEQALAAYDKETGE